MASRKATPRAMSARTGVAGALVTTPTACPAGLTLRSAAGLVPAGPGLGVGAAVITGKSPAAFPAPTRVVLRLGPGVATACMAPRRLAAPPGPMSELVALFGFGGAESRNSGGRPGEAEGVVVALEVAEPGPVELAVGVELEEAEDVGLAVGVGEVEGVELALGVGAGHVERVGLGVDVGGGDVEGAGLSLVVGAGVDGDGLGVSEALRPGLVLAAAGEGEESTALANAGSCQLPDSPMTSKPPVTRPAIMAARARLTCEPPLDDPLHLLTRHRGAATS